MAEAFGDILGDDFLFVVRGDVPGDLKRLNVMSVSAPRRFRSIFYFFCLPFLVVEKRWSNKDVIIFSTDPYLLVIIIFWRKVLGFKYLICSDWHQLFDDWRDKYISANSDYLISTSERLKGFLISVCGVNPKKIVAARGGVNLDLYKAKAKTNKLDYRINLKLPDGLFLVGYAGSFKAMGREKGVDTMIKSLPHLDKKIKMVFVGGTKQEIKEYSSLARETGVESRCVFAGRQPFDRVIEYQMAVDALVTANPDDPYFRNYCFPMNIWEYMAAGRPIIYSNLEIMDEIMKGRATSFEPDDPVSLANAITSVCQNIGVAEKVARQNTIDVTAHTWHSRARAIIDFVISK